MNRFACSAHVLMKHSIQQDVTDEGLKSSVLQNITTEWEPLRFSSASGSGRGNRELEKKKREPLPRRWTRALTARIKSGRACTRTLLRVEAMY